MSDFHKAMNNYKRFLAYYWITWKVYYTWWDPLLHPNFWNIMDETKKHWLESAIFWNFHLLNDENIQKLCDNDIKFYQLSMEWLRETHDNIRWEWTFIWVIDSIAKLEQKWIYTLVNMTLSKMNIDQLIPLIEFLAYHTNLSRFDFVRIVPIWKASKNIMLSDAELKSIFLKILELEKKIKKDWKKMVIWKKDHLWKLLYYQSDKLNINLKDQTAGCWMGYRHLTVIENWDIYLCRKLPIKIWNIITDDLIEIYENNTIISDVLNLNYVVWCHWCKLEYVCRWCPAVTYWLNNNLTKKDPQCRQNYLY
ncbi:MAG: Radical SAM protein [uncultured bacterium (gcode 4)]|uniref:Radical SAM protein n=1 Tax=uncultured bacterium (gcode 4) TaxID=1234023 RepID=K1YJW9_9BACT|nr:MAG: Radical SAM protein [uncultured bacterium (gcode 4)]